MGYGARKFRPVAGERHRAMVRNALSIYEDAMGRCIGRGRAVEAGDVCKHFERSGGCSRKQLRLVRGVVKARNNEAHFAGGAFGFGRAYKDVHLIADALDAFGLGVKAGEVRDIVAEADGGRWRRGRQRHFQNVWLGRRTWSVVIGLAVFVAAFDAMGPGVDHGTYSALAGLSAGCVVYALFAYFGKR